MEVDDDSLCVLVGDEPSFDLNIIGSDDFYIAGAHAIFGWVPVADGIVFGRTR